MAQLPPKIPNMSQYWPNFHHRRVPNTTQQPSWVEEFLDFSSAKRGSQRRSMSDSIAFLDAPLVEECQSTARPGNNEFDRLDDEQFMSMFSDDISKAVPPTASSSSPSTPSDHVSINDEKLMPSDQPVVQSNKTHMWKLHHRPWEVNRSWTPRGSRGNAATNCIYH